jgi:hypothetical protein
MEWYVVEGNLGAELVGGWRRGLPWVAPWRACPGLPSETPTGFFEVSRSRREREWDAERGVALGGKQIRAA